MKKTFWLIALVWACLMSTNASGIDDSRAELSWVDGWGYWLQNADIQTLVDCPYDLLVIDYSADGSDEMAYAASEIQQVKDAGKVVLAYLSIGEAEDYRFYWRRSWRRGRPKFIGPENPDWEGNYKVKYWHDGWWKKAIKPYLQRIISAGFDGVYLDIIDAYYYWGERGNNMRKSANRMASLVKRIAKYSRGRAGNGFIVCPQNGLSIIDDTSGKWRRRYMNVIDCVGVEDLFYNIWSEEDRDYRLNLLADFDQSDKRAFNVEYIEPEFYDAYFSLIENHLLDITGYIADPDRELDELIVHVPAP